MRFSGNQGGGLGNGKAPLSNTVEKTGVGGISFKSDRAFRKESQKTKEVKGHT